MPAFAILAEFVCGRRERFLVGLAWLALLAAAGLGAARLDLVLPWMIPACIIGLTAGAWCAGGGGTASVASAVIFAGFAMTIGLVPTTGLIGPVVGPLPADRLSAEPAALAYRLERSRVATEFAASRTFRGVRNGGAPVTWHAAPLVEDDWTRDRPVSAWVIAQETIASDPRAASSRNRWDEPIADVIRIAAPSSGRGPDVVALAVNWHGLQEARPRLLVIRSENPEADRQTDILGIAGLIAAACAAHTLIASRRWWISTLTKQGR
jgi:hypothetical protein